MITIYRMCDALRYSFFRAPEATDLTASTEPKVDGFVGDHRKLTDIKEVFQIRHATTYQETWNMTGMTINQCWDLQETAQTHNNKWDLKNRRLAQASTLRQVHRRSSA